MALHTYHNTILENDTETKMAVSKIHLGNDKKRCSSIGLLNLISCVTVVSYLFSLIYVRFLCKIEIKYFGYHYVRFSLPFSSNQSTTQKTCGPAERHKNSFARPLGSLNLGHGPPVGHLWSHTWKTLRPGSHTELQWTLAFLQPENNQVITVIEEGSRL